MDPFPLDPGLDRYQDIRDPALLQHDKKHEMVEDEGKNELQHGADHDAADEVPYHGPGDLPLVVPSEDADEEGVSDGKGEGNTEDEGLVEHRRFRAPEDGNHILDDADRHWCKQDRDEAADERALEPDFEELDLVLDRKEPLRDLAPLALCHIELLDLRNGVDESLRFRDRRC